MEQDTFFLRNMQELWRVNPTLARELDAVHPGRIPAGEPTRDGQITLRCATPGGSMVYLHSRYRAIEEAQSWAKSAAQGHDAKYVWVVSGFGLGYHIKALESQIPSAALIMVAEPDLALVRRALELQDFSALIRSERLLVFSSRDRGEMIRDLERWSIYLAGGMQFLVHNPSMQVAGEFHQAFQHIITDFVALTRSLMLTSMSNSEATNTNLANNVGRYVTTPPIDVLKNTFGGYPAILVSAGPSLARNFDQLEKARGKAVIICVQTMLKPLLAAGFVPDFVTSLDYNIISSRFFEGLEEYPAVSKVHLVAEPKAHCRVLDLFPGSMSVLHNYFTGGLLREEALRKDGLRSGATVAHLSLYLAEYMGCDPIILIGQDLGFVDGLYYKPGTAIHETWAPELGRFSSLETKEWERIVRSRSVLRKIPDIHGAPMYTEEQFFVYLQQFERDFANTRAQIIDATEGGALKKGVTLMTLAGAIEKFCTRPLSVDEPRAWKNWSQDPIQALKGALESMRLRRSECQEMLDACDQTLPLLEEMLTCLDEVPRVARLFVQVDKLRSRVGRNSRTFEMVGDTNFIGELRRFQNELALKDLDRVKDPKQFQRRQLLRDVDYVRQLRVGAEQFLKLILHGIVRLEGQIQALEQGDPWPVI